jgi:hypothetical protein
MVALPSVLNNSTEKTNPKNAAGKTTSRAHRKLAHANPHLKPNFH